MPPGGNLYGYQSKGLAGEAIQIVVKTNGIGMSVCGEEFEMKWATHCEG